MSLFSFDILSRLLTSQRQVFCCDLMRTVSIAFFSTTSPARLILPDNSIAQLNFTTSIPFIYKMTCHCVDHVCSPSPCVNGGMCIVKKSFGNHRWTFKCVCPHGFKGKLCHSKWTKKAILDIIACLIHAVELVNPKPVEFSAVVLNNCWPAELLKHIKTIHQV